MLLIWTVIGFVIRSWRLNANEELTLETSLEVECELGLSLWLSSASTDYVIANDPSRGHVDLLKTASRCRQRFNVQSM